MNTQNHQKKRRLNNMNGDFKKVSNLSEKQKTLKVVRLFKTCVNRYEIEFNGKDGELPKYCQDCPNYQLMIPVDSLVAELQKWGKSFFKIREYIFEKTLECRPYDEELYKERLKIIWIPLNEVLVRLSEKEKIKK